ncbi:family 1 encapsulin nanocompartment shell protein [Salininema proteolyticum]|uniref:Type 1 encapsulin shell protein n=1 Tax=Salininema proteolyticum TaxID=1607685 RepID=A0ABV8U1Z3_9ACTN
MTVDNLHRELAPISNAAWQSIEEEATRTFARHVSCRRVVDVNGPKGTASASVTTGHEHRIDPPAEGVQAFLREAQPLAELRVPFKVARQEIDNVERGAEDSDWSPVMDAAKRLAFTEDRLVVDGYDPAGITGIRRDSSNEAIALPERVTEYPNAVAQAVSRLRLDGVGGPYTLLLSAEAYTAVSETTDEGNPILDHVKRMTKGEILWAPAISGALLLSARGGDFALTLGQEVSIGYLSHDSENVELYFTETLTFQSFTSEASVSFR